MVAHCEGALFINPGSPTLPVRGQDAELGTLGILEIGVASQRLRSYIFLKAKELVSW